MIIKKMLLTLNISLMAIFIIIVLSLIRSINRVNIETPQEPIYEHELAIIPEHEIKSLSHYSLVIGRRTFFGSPPPYYEEIKVLPRTDLKLRLKGTIYGYPSSYAIVKDLITRRQGLYQVGDIIFGVRIVRIYRNRMVIKRDGREEILISHWEDMLTQRHQEEPPTHLSLQPLKPAPIRTRPIKPALITQPDEHLVMGEGEITTAIETAGKIMGRLRIDPRDFLKIPANIIKAVDVANEVLANAKIRPHFDGGRLRGIRIAEIQPGSIYELIGLQSGDIIKTINGHQVNSVRSVLRIYNEIRQKPIITVSMDRNGQLVTLVHRIRPGE